MCQAFWFENRADILYSSDFEFVPHVINTRRLRSSRYLLTSRCHRKFVVKTSRPLLTSLKSMECSGHSSEIVIFTEAYIRDVFWTNYLLETYLPWLTGKPDNLYYRLKLWIFLGNLLPIGYISKRMPFRVSVFHLMRCRLVLMSFDSLKTLKQSFNQYF